MSNWCLLCTCWLSGWWGWRSGSDLGRGWKIKNGGWIMTPTIVDREERNIESSTAEVIDNVRASDLDLLSRPYAIAAVMSRVGITSSSQDLKDTIVD